MHTVELLEEAIALAERSGYRLRYEWLGGDQLSAGACGGACEIKGQKWIFLDVALGPADQLDLVIQALRSEPDVLSLPMPHRLRELLELRKSA